jgi:hypothetical protein
MAVPHMPYAVLASTLWLGLMATPWWVALCALGFANISETNARVRSDRLSGIAPCDERDREVAMIHKAKIRRRFWTRDEAHRYLASRGFLFLPQGWANGRWTASVDQDVSGFALTIGLRLDAAGEVKSPNRPNELPTPCAKARAATFDLSLRS